MIPPVERTGRTAAINTGMNDIFVPEIAARTVLEMNDIMTFHCTEIEVPAMLKPTSNRAFRRQTYLHEHERRVNRK